MDSTIIEAPSSTKNQKKERDPNAHQVRKGNTWYFGYKAHIGVDKDSGLAQTVEIIGANIYNVSSISFIETKIEKIIPYFINYS